MSEAVRPCGAVHDGPCLAVGAGPDATVQGICDDCGRVVRPTGRGVELQLDRSRDWTGAQLIAAAVEAAADAIARGRCATCGMIRSL